MKMNNVILVPTDFSEVCKNAIDYASQIARSFGNLTVHIFHIINKDTQAYFKGSENINQAVEDKLKGLVDEFNLKHGVNLVYSYESGSIFDLIHEKAEKIGANFIILGTHGKRGLQHLMGSYALKVLSKSPVPTLVVQNKSYQGFKNVLMPVNTFTEARQKVEIAKQVSEKFGAIIHIFKEKVSNPSDSSRIEIISRQIVNEFDKQKINYSVKQADESHDSAKKLVQYAVSNNMDMIMILTEPQIGTSYYNLGPWNEKIMFNEAQIPVLCINPVQHGYIYFDL